MPYQQHIPNFVQESQWQHKWNWDAKRAMVKIYSQFGKTYRSWMSFNVRVNFAQGKSLFTSQETSFFPGSIENGAGMTLKLVTLMLELWNWLSQTLERIKRSAPGWRGSLTEYLISPKKRVATISAAEALLEGCPDLEAQVISMEKIRMRLAASSMRETWSVAVFLIESVRNPGKKP